jgi:serine/threonine-protein kinase
MIAVGDVVLERYRAVEQIGSGGHSVVFRGEDVRLARSVCIKVFSGVGGASGVGRTSYEHFVQEAYALSRLTHPNTLRIYDFGHLGPEDAGGMPLQVCEYMNGGTLSQVVRERGPQSLAETVRVIGAMCAALAEAHGLGIVHRDIKPQNILFGTAGGAPLPKLADFGIAKWSADADERSPRAEDTAIVAGQKLAMYSPSWAAPEQLAGQPVSGATDIYSLAVVAIFMLSGKAIFAEEDVYAGYKKRRRGDELVRATLAPLAVPDRVLELLSQALAFDAKARLADVRALERGLAVALAAPRFVAPAATLPGVGAPPPAGAYVLALVDGPQLVGERRVQVIHLAGEYADLHGPDHLRVRITLLDTPGGRLIHCKGLSCFVAPVGGRPSPAVQLDRPGEVSLVTPRAQEVGRVRFTLGDVDGAVRVFALGDARVAVRAEDAADPLLFDFGPGSDAYFVYTRGRTIARPPRR